MKLELDGLTKEFGDFTAVNHINLTMTNVYMVIYKWSLVCWGKMEQEKQL